LTALKAVAEVAESASGKITPLQSEKVRGVQPEKIAETGSWKNLPQNHGLLSSGLVAKNLRFS
jgi:hypothetical protein